MTRWGCESQDIEHEIDYTYDGPYRLTDAEYSNGDYYRYTYDAVGNRLTQETIAETNTYTYDAANRMTSVDGVPYTWDANGNMLSDGTSTYTYDHANRLTGVTTDSIVSSYTYNGFGSRYQQSINETTTTYQLDLASGLVQILSDGHDSYLYGNTVLAQVSDTQIGYYLPDVLGSVRQMVDGEANVQLSQRYSPFGEELEKFGDGISNIGYTSELYDQQTGFIYLRSRYYSPNTGRFTTRDIWQGDFYSPQTINGWVYVINNPINFVDPTGYKYLDPSDPTKRGTIIHMMIELFYAINFGHGSSIGEFPVKSGSATLLRQLYRKGKSTTYQPEYLGLLAYGFADIVDEDEGGLYEIKPHKALELGKATVLWYLAALNGALEDPDDWYRPGAKFPPLDGVIIGPDPADPKNSTIKAGLAYELGTSTGVILYWSVKGNYYSNPSVPLPYPAVQWNEDTQKAEKMYKPSSGFPEAVTAMLNECEGDPGKAILVGIGVGVLIYLFYQTGGGLGFIFL